MTQRIRALDGVRGLAASAVIFYHAILHNDTSLLDRVLTVPIQSLHGVRDIATKVALMIFNGELAVIIFFVLSGFVLQQSLARRADEDAVPLSAGFITARLIRLYPPLIACITFYWAISLLGIHGFPIFTPKTFFDSATLLNITYHGPSTTIQAEVMAVPFILGTFLLRRYFGPAVFFYALAAGAAAFQTPFLAFNLPNMNIWLIYFMAGMAVAELCSLQWRAPQRALWLIMAPLFILPGIQAHTVPALIGMAMLAGGLLITIQLSPRSAIHQMLDSLPIQALGRVSYSLYLFNVPVLVLIWAFTDRWEFPKAHALEFGLVVGIVSLAATWPLAWISERWVERPAIAIGQRWAAAVRASLRSVDRSHMRPGWQTSATPPT